MSKISILGCGWLGFPLAKAFLEKNYSIKTSTTTPSRLDLLESFGMNPYLISLREAGIEGDISSFLNGSEIIIIDIPPKLRGVSSESFVAKISHLIAEIEKSTVSKVLFISSTAVYADNASIKTVTEEFEANPETESGKQLLESEKILLENPNFQTTVLRFGGLIGEDRHPVKFLSGRDNLSNPKGPINLIHLEDCIGIILRIIEKNIWNETFNAVAPFHETRKEYYTKKAIGFGLPLPQFKDEVSIGKIVSSEKLERILGYEFIGI